jgi:hypothetical protein
MEESVLVFKDTRIETVMKQIGGGTMWKLYTGGVIPQGHYKGVIGQKRTAAKMIQVFNASGIRCRLKGGRWWCYQNSSMQAGRFRFL